MNLTRYEQETIINFNEEEDEASVYTHNRPLIHRLEQLAQERPEECRLVNAYPTRRAVEYYVPVHWLRINPPRKAAPLSEEQKQQRREHLANMRKSGSGTGRARQEQGRLAAPTGNYIPQAPDTKKEA